MIKNPANDNQPCCSKSIKCCPIQQQQANLANNNNHEHDNADARVKKVSNPNSPRKGKSFDLFPTPTILQNDMNSILIPRRGRSCCSSACDVELPAKSEVIVETNCADARHDLGLLRAAASTKKLEEELKFMRNNFSKPKSKVDIPELPPMVELLRCTHGELIRRLIETHDELTHLKRLQSSKSKGSFPRNMISTTSTCTSPSKGNKIESEVVVVDPRIQVGKKTCSVTTSFPLSTEQELCVMSYYQLEPPQPHISPSTTSILLAPHNMASSSISVLSNKDFSTRIYEDVKNMNEVTLVETTSSAMSNTISTASMIHSDYSRLMQYLDEKEEDPSELCLKPSTSPLNPIETLILNERTMKHILLYVNPKTTMSNAKLLPKHESGQHIYQPTIYDERNYISPGLAVTCFEESQMDLELKKIFKQCPPIRHKLYVKRKSRRARGSSVPAIDSFKGTKDMRMFGHPSYFMPQLKTKQRKLLGWRPSFRKGKRKYHENYFRNIAGSSTSTSAATWCEKVSSITLASSSSDTHRGHGGSAGPSVARNSSLESFERGPRIVPYALKPFIRPEPFLVHEISKPEIYKPKKQSGLRKLLNRLLPCWWELPEKGETEDDEEDEDEEWYYVEHKTYLGRFLRNYCCDVELSPPSSAHDIIMAEVGSGEFVTVKPERVLKPVPPGPDPRHTAAHKWLLPSSFQNLAS